MKDRPSWPFSRWLQVRLRGLATSPTVQGTAYILALNGKLWPLPEAEHPSFCNFSGTEKVAPGPPFLSNVNIHNILEHMRC